MNTWQKILHYAHEAICENGETSSKRIAGLFGIFIAHFIMSYAGVRYGITDHIKDCWNVLIITDGSLLGITAITKALQK